MKLYEKAENDILNLFPTFFSSGGPVKGRSTRVFFNYNLLKVIKFELVYQIESKLQHERLILYLKPSTEVVGKVPLLLQYHTFFGGARGRAKLK